MSGELSAAPYHSPGREGGRKGGREEGRQGGREAIYSAHTVIHVHVHVHVSFILSSFLYSRHHKKVSVPFAFRFALGNRAVCVGFAWCFRSMYCPFTV